jgi:cell wall-associated NlpC family hydrolase
MTPEQRRRATEFLERLLAEPKLRADFRRQPVTTCRAFALDEFADELERAVRGTETLEQRESRSGMAGVMIAVAAEGVGLAELLARHATEMGEAAAATASGLIEQIDGTDTATAPQAHAPAGGSRPDPATSPIAAGPVSSTAADPTGLPATRAPGTRGSPIQAAGAGVPVPVDPAGLPPAIAQPAAPEAPPSAHDEGQPAADPEPAGADAAAQQMPQRSERQTRQAAPQTTAAEGIMRPGQLAEAVLEQASHTADGYPGDVASKEQIAAWMARRATAAGMPEELPVMGALVESGLANLPGGDRDSVGFFQMRLGIWNRGEYRGYPSDPERQLRWFLDRARAVKASRIAAGDVEFGRDPGSWGAWVADVEGPAEAYRGRYQEQLETARALLASAAPPPGADPPAVNTGRPEPGAPQPVSAGALAADVQAIDPTAVVDSTGEQAVALAKRYLGDAYVWGGASPQTGFDCSGLVQYVYGQAGVQLPRVTHEQFVVGQAVDRSALRTGDIVFFREPDGYIGHEGLYLGAGRFLHAPHTGDVVKISSLDEPYFDESFAGARRVGDAAADDVIQHIDMMRRTAGELVATREHDARVLPVLDPAAPRPGTR